MYDNDRDASQHDEETDHESNGGGLRSTVNRFWDRLTRQNHADYVDDDEYEESTGTPVAAAPASASGGGSNSHTTATVGGARIYGVGGTSSGSASSGGSSYGRVTAPQPVRSRDTFRVAPAGGREQSISVMPVASFGDVQKAADRLKAGEPQIVNLEKTPPEVAERLIDFLNGVTYALDGFVEKVSEGAYLFTPSHIAIHADGPEPPQPKPYFDRL